MFELDQFILFDGDQKQISVYFICAIDEVYCKLEFSFDLAALSSYYLKLVLKKDLINKHMSQVNELKNNCDNKKQLLDKFEEIKRRSKRRERKKNRNTRVKNLRMQNEEIIKTKDDKNEDKMYSNLPENELNNPEKQNNIFGHLWKTIRYQIMK